MNDSNLQDIVSINAADIKAWQDFLDLFIPITIELGRTKMTVADILAIEAETVIQLPRSTGEGVDVIAGDQCIARGEIITIEDRTGVRLSEVTTPKQKY
ncbi:MAG: FliM/FliN family flagellar motor switch protein [Acidobacteriota bacterium]